MEQEARALQEDISGVLNTLRQELYSHQRVGGKLLINTDKTMQRARKSVVTIEKNQKAVQERKCSYDSMHGSTLANIHTITVT